MIILICGDRDWKNKALIKTWLSQMFGAFKNGQVLEFFPVPKGEKLEVISGGASGADLLTEEICQELGIPFRRFPAEWARFGRAAGPIRNTKMIEQKPALVLAFHDDLHRSKGTRDMCLQAIGAKVQTIQIFSHGGAAALFTPERKDCHGVCRSTNGMQNQRPVAVE